MSAGFRAICALIVCTGLLVMPARSYSQTQTVLPPAPKPYVMPPYVKAQELFFADKFVELDALAKDLAARDVRDQDGLPELMRLTHMLGLVMVPWDGEKLEENAGKVQKWLQSDPKSAFAPIVEAQRLIAVGDRARGGGYANQVTDEGWQIFHEQNQAAWDLLVANKKRSSSIPSWYELALSAGYDAKVPVEKLRDVFDEGKKRFPNHYAIYFEYERGFAPRWGGSYEAARDFILQQADAATNKDGDALYTRLYWSLDNLAGHDQDFFGVAQVNWPRMRNGFFQLLTRYPDSVKNLTVFGVFACRARDEDTYRKLRPKLTGENFMEFVPSEYTLEVCDRRFAKRN